MTTTTETNDQEQRRQKWLAHRNLMDELFQAQNPTWEGLRQFAARLFTARLEELGGKPITRRPPWSLRLAVPGEPPAHLVLRPNFTPPFRRSGQPGVLSPEKVRLELMVARIPTKGSPTGENRPIGGWELQATLTPGTAAIVAYNLAYGPEAIERASAAAVAFVADPLKALALSADRCCLCGHKLTDEVSRSRGVGPECVRFLNAVVGTYSERRVRQAIAGWESEVPSV